MMMVLVVQWVVLLMVQKSGEPPPGMYPLRSKGPFCSSGFGVGFGYLNTLPNRVFGALGYKTLVNHGINYHPQLVFSPDF